MASIDLIVGVQGPASAKESKGVYIINDTSFSNTRINKEKARADMNLMDGIPSSRSPYSFERYKLQVYLAFSKDGLHLVSQKNRNANNMLFGFGDELYDTLRGSMPSQRSKFLKERLDNVKSSVEGKKVYATITELGSSHIGPQYLMSLFIEETMTVQEVRTETMLVPIGSFYLIPKVDLESIVSSGSSLISNLFSAEYTGWDPTAVPTVCSSRGKSYVLMPENNLLEAVAIGRDAQGRLRLETHIRKYIFGTIPKEDDQQKEKESPKDTITSYDIKGEYAAAIIVNLDIENPAFIIEVQKGEKKVCMNMADLDSIGLWPRSVKLAEISGDMYCFVGCDSGFVYTFQCGTSKEIGTNLKQIKKHGFLEYNIMTAEGKKEEDDEFRVKQMVHASDGRIIFSCYNLVYRARPEFFLRTNGGFVNDKMIAENSGFIEKAELPHRITYFKQI